MLTGIKNVYDVRLIAMILIVPMFVPGVPKILREDTSESYLNTIEAPLFTVSDECSLKDIAVS